MNTQRGMTLVELLISMVLSLGIIAGISSLFGHMQKSSKIQRAMATMADDGSYVLEVLQKEIRRTSGLRSQSDINGTDDRIFLWPNNVLNTGLNFAGEEYIKGDATSPVNDAFMIRYQLLDANDLSAAAGTSNGSSPCTQNVLLDSGEDPSSQNHVVSLYFYIRSDVDHPEHLTLSCTAKRELIDTATTSATCLKNCESPPADAPVDLISNAVLLNVSYGVDPDNDKSANYYTDAATLTAVSPLWLDVISVRFSIVLRSEEKFLRDSSVAYTLDGVGHTPDDDQHQLYKVFTSTVALRNRLL